MTGHKQGHYPEEKIIHFQPVQWWRVHDFVGDEKGGWEAVFKFISLAGRWDGFDTPLPNAHISNSIFLYGKISRERGDLGCFGEIY